MIINRKIIDLFKAIRCKKVFEDRKFHQSEWRKNQ